MASRLGIRSSSHAHPERADSRNLGSARLVDLEKMSENSRFCRLGQRAGGQESGPAGGAAVCAGCAMGNIRAEETSEAKDDWGGLLELHPLMGDLLYSLSYAELRAGLATDAARRIEHAIAQYPDHPKAEAFKELLTSARTLVGG